MALRKSRDAEACWAMHLNTSYRSLLPSFWQTHTQLHCKFVSPVGGLPIDCPLPTACFQGSPGQYPRTMIGGFKTLGLFPVQYAHHAPGRQPVWLACKL